MKKHRLFLILVILLLLSFIGTLAQENAASLPEFPPDEMYDFVLYPHAELSGELGDEEESITYLLLAEHNEDVSLELVPEIGSFRPLLQLLDAEGEELASASEDIFGLASLNYNFDERAWYLVRVSSEGGTGKYHISTFGSSAAVYSLLLAVDVPVLEDSIVLLAADTILSDFVSDSRYLIPVREGSQLSFDYDSSLMRLELVGQDFAPLLPAGSFGPVAIDRDQWLSLTVRDYEGRNDRIVVSIEANDLVVAQARLSDLATITPSPTVTATFTATITSTASNTPRFTNTPTPTNTATASNTPRPTNTVRPTNTQVPRQQDNLLQYGDFVNDSASRTRQVDYQFEGQSGEVITIELRSDDFDTYLELYEGRSLVASDDDGLGNLDSTIDNFTLGRTGTYTIRVKAYSGSSFSGRYTLSLVRVSRASTSSNTSSSSNRIAYGESINASARNSSFVDYQFSGSQNDVITIELTSPDFDTFLELYNGNNLLSSDDDGLGNLDSTIVNYRLTSSSTYTIRVRAFGGNSFTGTYTLSLRSSRGSNTTSNSNNTQLPTCPGTLPSRLRPGDTGRVIPIGSGNRLRSGAGTSYEQVGRMGLGEEFEVVDGPVCANGFAWYLVDYFGTRGWTAEADDEEYWLEPISSGTSGASNSSGTPVLLAQGTGLTDGRTVRNGEFQVEYYCRNYGGGISNDNNNWYCVRNGQRSHTLSQADFDQICRDTYNRSDAFALQNGSGSIAAYRWRCYAYDNSGTSNNSSNSNSSSSSNPPRASSGNCPPTNFGAGDSVVVDFNNDGALRIVQDYQSERVVTLAQLYDNAQIQLVDGPFCYGGVNYWQIYSSRVGSYGYIAEGRDGDRFLCPSNNPECS